MESRIIHLHLDQVTLITLIPSVLLTKVPVYRAYEPMKIFSGEIVESLKLMLSFRIYKGCLESFVGDIIFW